MSTDDNDKTRLVNQPSNPKKPDATVVAGTSGSSYSPPDEDRTVLSSSDTAPPPSQTNTIKLINNRFRLESLLGSGGMGSVYKAVDQRKVEARDRNPYVALKLLNDDFKQHPDAFVSLQRESRKSQNLAHPNIVTVYDFDRDGDMVFMTMEYLEGSPLDELLRKSGGVGLEYEQACQILRDISAALGYAHSKNIVHSDFKPGNIYVTDNDGAKVFDFGIARAVSGGGSGAPSEDDKTVFDAGTLSALTPAYASYEMLKGEEPSTSDDVYALGCIAYELFTGTHPFNKTPADKAEEQHLRPKRIKRLSKRQWLCLEKALAFHSKDRIQTVKDFEHGVFGRSKWPYYSAAAVLVMATASALFYQQQNMVDVEQVREELQVDMRAGIELELNQKSSLEELLAAINEPLTSSWDENVFLLFDAYHEISPEAGNILLAVHQDVMNVYLTAAVEARESAALVKAAEYLGRAEQWLQSISHIELDALSLDHNRETLNQQKIAQKKAEDEEASRIAEARQQEQERLAREQKARQERLARDAREKARQQAEQQYRQQVEESKKAVQQALVCNSQLNISNTLATRLDALKQLSESEYNRIVPTAITSLSSCIQRVSGVNPATASRFQAAALQQFPQAEAIATIDIDFCGHLTPGSGSNGRRYFCYDRLASGGLGPALVVAMAERTKLAVTRAEVTIGEYNQFCQSSSQCNPLEFNSDLPVHNISVDQAKAYASWLSSEAGHPYRIPTYSEWLAVASP